MEASELRIGNWVIDNNRSVQVGATDFNYCEVFAPIPITEEWLLKFGFQKGKFDYLKNNLEILELNNNGIFDAYCTDLEFSVFISEIKYVHSLQNLYFALTGEELTIKDQ